MVRLHLRKPQNTMVNVAQSVEPGIVIPVVVGSSPIIHPNKQWMRSSIGRASACHVEGKGIETPISRQFCSCVYGYPYVIRESTKPLVYVLEARSKPELIVRFSARLGHCVAINKFISMTLSSIG